MGHHGSETAQSRLEEALALFYASQKNGGFQEVYVRLSGADDPSLSVDQRVMLQIALATCEEMLGLLEDADDRLSALESWEGVAHRDRFRAAYYLTFVRLRLTRLAEAKEALRTMEELLAPSDSTMQSRYYFAVGTVAQESRDWQQSQRALRRAMQLDPSLTLNAVLGLSRGHITRGEFREALLLLERTSEEAVDEYNRVALFERIAAAALGLGDLERAKEVSEELLLLARGADMTLNTALAHLFLALIAHGNDSDAAVKHLSEAVWIDASPQRTEETRVLEAWMRQEQLPETTHADASALKRVLMGDREPSTPLAAVLVAVLERAGNAVALEFRTEDGAALDLGRRPALRRILARLVETTESRPASTAELFEHGWPDTSVVGSNGFRRVYSELHRLRALGLDIVNTGDGYVLRTRLTQSH